MATGSSAAATKLESSQSERKLRLQAACARFKAEHGMGVKGEAYGCGEVRTKVESRVKAECHVKAESHLKDDKDDIKAEVKAVKGEVKKEARDWGSELMHRGLQLRANAKLEHKVKQELGRQGKKGKKGKKGKGVKREPGKPKRRASAKRRASSREVMKREVALSPELAAYVGAPALSRPEVVSRIWSKAKELGLRNPDNSREICCDTELETLLGQPKVGLMQLSSLLVPHFDYTQPVAAVKRAAKDEPRRGRPPKHETKFEAKREAGAVELGRAKTEASLNTAPRMPSGTPKLETAKVETLDEEPSVCQPRLKQAKQETVLPSGDTGEAANSIAPELLDIAPSTARVCFEVPQGPFEYTAVAETTPGDAGPSCRVSCAISMQEEPGRGLVASAEAELSGLDPCREHRISVEVRPRAGTSGDTARSVPVLLMRRSPMQAWTPREAVIFCASLRIPDLARKAKEYAIDGKTLLALTEEDLRALGLAPFLIRRVLCALDAFRS